MLEELTPRVREVLGADAAAVLLTDENGRPRAGGHAPARCATSPPRLALGEGYAGPGGRHERARR